MQDLARAVANRKRKELDFIVIPPLPTSQAKYRTWLQTVRRNVSNASEFPIPAADWLRETFYKR